MKENAHHLSDKDACLSMIDPSDLKALVQIQRGQLACLLIDTNNNNLKALRERLFRQLLLQRAIFEDDLRSYWNYRHPEADGGGGSSIATEGLGLLRLIDLNGATADRVANRIAPFQASTLASRAGLDALLVPTILQRTMARCITCDQVMHQITLPELSKLSDEPQTFFIAGQASAPAASTLNVGQLIEMTQVERVVIGDRLLSIDQISVDADFSLADRVVDFGRKYPSLFLVLDSLTLRRESDPGRQLEAAILVAEKRWCRPVWLFKSAGRELISDRLIASQGQFCKKCHYFLEKLSAKDLRFEDGALICPGCQGSGLLVHGSVCDKCCGVGLVSEWSRGTIFGVELNQLSHLTVAALKSKIESAHSIDSTQLLQTLKLLVELGFADYMLGHSSCNWSTGETVRWQIFDQVACNINDSLIVLDFILDVFEVSELKNIFRSIRSLAASGNAALILSAREEIARECDHIHRAFKHPEISPRVSNNGTYKVIKLKNVQVFPWAGQEIVLPTGGLFCLSGPSGSGKTILLRDILADLFRRGGPKLGMLDSDSQISQNDFNFFDYLDFCNKADLSTDSLASLAGLDELLAGHFTQSKEARLKGILKKDFLLNRMRVGRPHENVLSLKWNGLQYGKVFDLTWLELYEQLSFDEVLASLTGAFCDLGLGGFSCGTLLGDLSCLERVRALFALAFAKRKARIDTKPGVFFALNYPFLGHSPDVIMESFKLMRALVDKGHTIYCVSNDRAIFGLFDCVLQVLSNRISQFVPSS